MPFRFLDHVADERVACWGANLDELFTSAMDALYAVALQDRRDETPYTRRIQLEGDGLDDLMVRWLQELIYLLDVEHFAAAAVEFDRIDTHRLDAVLQGYRCRPEDRKTEVKAATYHGIAVEHRDGQYRAEVLFDL